MKKTLTFIFIILIIISHAACQPTPSEEVVIGKNALQEKLQSTASPSMTSDRDMKPVENVVVGRWIESIEVVKSTINIDADIVMPASNCAVLRVAPRDFTQQDVENAINVFAKDAALSNYTFRTKSFIENEILNHRRYIADIEAGNYYNDDGKTAKEKIKEYEDKIKELETEYVNAPEYELSNELVNKEFFEDENGGEAVYLYFLNNDQIGKNIIIQNNSENITSSLIFTDEKFPTEHKRLSETELRLAESELPSIDEIEEFLSVYFDKIGIGKCNMQRCEMLIRKKNGKESYVYSMDFSKDYGNGEIAFIEIKPAPLDSNKVIESYNHLHSKEEIQIITDGKTIFDFWWLVPHSVLEEVNNNVETIEIKKMKSLMENQITRIVKGQNIPVSIKISQIKMSYNYLQIPNDRTYLVVPVWDMLGTEKSEYSDGQNTVSFVTLNAIDGTVINRELGY